MQVGFVGPTVRKGGRFYYTFCDLVAVKSAKDLLAADIPLQTARKAVEQLKKVLPGDTHPTSRLRVCSDGETIVALADDVAFEPLGGQIVMAFTLPSFGEHIAGVLAMPRVDPAGLRPAAAQAPILRHRMPSRMRRPRPTAARPRIATSSRRAPPRIAATPRPPSICSARRSISSRTWRPR